MASATTSEYAGWTFCICRLLDLFLGYGGAVVVVTYVTASVFFWRNPHFLHKKKPTRFIAKSISHRGGSAEGYENTLKNYHKAIKNGSQMLELDVRLTKDGQVVVYHDADLKRLTGKASLVCELDFSELPTLRPEVPIDTVPGEVFTDASWSDEERKIPLLRQVFEQFPGVPINIDLKEFDPNLVDKVSCLVNEYKRSEITVWGSFNHKTCDLCYKSNPEVGLFVSAKKTLIMSFLAATGLLPFIPIKETHYEVFLPAALKKRIIQQKGRMSFVEHALYLFCNSLMVSRPLIGHLRKRGIDVYLWVCNSEDEYQECLDLGANGIMTDYPTKLDAFLQSSQLLKNI